MSLVANWSYPTAVRFGAGRISELADAAKAAGMKKPLLVTDKGLASLPITANALDILDAAGLGRGLFRGLRRGGRRRQCGRHRVRGWACRRSRRLRRRLRRLSCCGRRVLPRIFNG